MASTREFGSLRHLAGRFTGALLPHGPPDEDERWAGSQLNGGEQALWRRMSGPDRRHAVGVARRAVADVQDSAGGTPASREFVAAALLHDVGKVEAGLGTWTRAGVTLAAMTVSRARLVNWTTAHKSRGWRRRIGVYLTHDRVGADLLVAAGSDPFTAAWAGEHHLPPALWSVDARLGHALKLADDD
jgi:hypothetical protein